MPALQGHASLPPSVRGYRLLAARRLRHAGLALRLMAQGKGACSAPATRHRQRREILLAKVLGEEEVLAGLEMTARRTARK